MALFSLRAHIVGIKGVKCYCYFLLFVHKSGEVCNALHEYPCLLLQGGCVDSTSQSLACVMMTLGDQDVSKLQTGPLSPYT